MDVDTIFKKAVELESSDILLTAGAKPFIRKSGELEPLEEFSTLTKSDTSNILKSIYLAHDGDLRNEHMDLNFSYAMDGLARFRINAFRQRGSTCLAVRIISHEVPTIESLYLPSFVKNIATLSRGLFIFSGIVGSGKTTTIAAVVNEINRTSHRHILTIENPIEYLHSHDKSIVNQREVDSDVTGVIEGLTSATKGQADVIMISEINEDKVIKKAWELVEMGHLVLAAVDSGSAIQTIEHLADKFSSEEKNQVYERLATVCEGVICQYLIDQKGKERQIPVVEVLQITDTARNLLSDGKISQLRSLLKGGNKHNMQSFQCALDDLYKRGLIDRENYDYESMLHNRRKGTNR